MKQRWNLRLKDRAGLSPRSRFVRTRRRVQLVMVIGLGWMAFCVIGAAFFVQQKESVLESTDYVDVRKKRGPRGPIVDRNGVIMAEDLVTEALTADPRWVHPKRPKSPCMELDPDKVRSTRKQDVAFRQKMAEKIAEVLVRNQPTDKVARKSLKTKTKEVLALLSKQTRQVTLRAGVSAAVARELRRMIQREKLSFLTLVKRTLEFSPDSFPKYRKPSVAKAQGKRLGAAIARPLGVSADDLSYQIGFALRMRKKRTLIHSLRPRQVRALGKVLRTKKMRGFDFTYALRVDPVEAARLALHQLPLCNKDIDCQNGRKQVCRDLPDTSGGGRCVAACTRLEQGRDGSLQSASKSTLTLAARERWATLIEQTISSAIASTTPKSQNAKGAQLSSKKEAKKSRKFRKLRRNLGYETSHVYIAKELPLWKVDRFKTMLVEGQLPGVSLEQSTRRHNPSSAVAGSLLGRSSWPGSIERMLDLMLQGRQYKVVTLRTVGGRRMPWYGSSDPNHYAGNSAQLTLDSVVQEVAEHHLNKGVADAKAKFGVAVVIDVRTAEVIAMAQTGQVNPNDRLTSAAATKNKVTQDGAEPGSTLKALVLATAFDLGVVKPSDLFDATKGIKAGSKVIRDSHRHGVLTACDCLKVSSNICFGKIAMKIGKKRLDASLRRFGLGVITNVGLPGESSGKLASYKTWPFSQFINIAFGQGVVTTPLQIARAYTAIANGGVLRRPRLLREFRRADGKVIEHLTFEVEPGQRVISASAARETMRCLSRVTKKGGTARRARLPNYSVAGKTGTAQQAENGRYSKTHWVASFAMVTPVQNPRYVIYVAVDTPDRRHPKYPNLVIRTGGAISAPVAREIARFLLPYAGVATSPGAPWLTYDDPKEAQARAARRQAKKRKPAKPIEVVQPAPAPLFKVPAGKLRMPSLRGMPMAKAVRTLLAKGLKPRVRGSGVVFQQTPSEGAVVRPGTLVRLVLAPPSATARLPQERP